MLNYNDIARNTYIQSLTFTEIMAIEKCGLLGVHVMYALRDAILVHCACPAVRHRHAVTLASALQHGSADVTR
jgi:hypothetical protein